MDKLTFEVSYASDLAAAIELAQRLVNSGACDGNARNWIADALNSTWSERISIAEWVARAVQGIPRESRAD